MPMLHRRNRNPEQEKAPENTVDKHEENPQKENNPETSQTESASAGDRAGEDQKSEKYSFLQETIKPEPLSRERLFRQSARLALYGVILGIFACLGFFTLKPWAEQVFQGNPETVTIPEDEEPSEEEQEAEEEKTQETEQKLDALSYEEMLQSIYTLAGEAKKSVATVSRTSSEEEDWADETTGIEDSVTGIITADNGQELLIFAADSVCSGTKSWTVTFADSSRYAATLKMRDRNRSLAVFSIPRADISSATWSSVEVAVLGNSNLVQQGEPVIALGNTFSYADGIGYGIISSTDYKETFYDGECDILATDISAATDGSGVLFNMQGEVVGLVMPSIWEDKESNTANAYSISDLKSVIELMANGEKVPYIGVYATTVTSRLKEEQGMPEGIYVIDVDPDSPAMAAGIQSGDIICEINGEEVSSLVTYQRAALETRTDQEIEIRGMRLGADGYVDVNYTVTVGQK